MFAGCSAQGAIGFAGLSGFGSPDARPNANYVMAGDVVRIQLAILSSLTMGNPGIFRSALGADNHVRVVSFDDSKISILNYWGSSPLTLDVQALNDFSQLNDVLTYVAGVAQGNGLSVDLGHSNISFVSKVEQTQGQVRQNLPAPSDTSNSANAGDKSAGGQFTDFINNLTKSPTTLAVIAASAVLLIIAVKNK